MSKLANVGTLTSIAIAFLTLSAPPVFSVQSPDPVENAIFLLDDQSGPELETLHGIKPIQISDMETLLNGVVQAKRPIRIFHQVVDEDSSDNEVVLLHFQPFTGGQPPKAPAENLPLRELESATEEYLKLRNIWNGKMRAYRTKLKDDAEGFIRKISANQAALSERFDRLLAARNGVDFNRSDIVGSVLSANRALGVDGTRILVVNSDGEDMAANRKPRRTALTPEELSPEIVIIFVNQSRIPDQSPLFRDLPNRTLRADTMKDAMVLALGLLEGASPEEQ